MKAQKGKKKSTEEKGPNPYDFSLKRQTRLDKAATNTKPARPELMAAGMLKAHGLEKAKRIVEPLTVSSFKDKDGNPVAVNESSSYWKHVLQYLNKGKKNAIAS